ncbi:hypothetical protein B0H17DRAFT_1028160 [Mycena rosella]|uniref:Uncharacterized protein n=1 Tax=Mycena rosella TaxID=1033263 RepID=A0AAD7MBY2_MYCRO|nr:hypothetical protein B0H17DRAFT_1028160 [Mycena rosella]
MDPYSLYSFCHHHPLQLVLPSLLLLDFFPPLPICYVLLLQPTRSLLFFCSLSPPSLHHATRLPVLFCVPLYAFVVLPPRGRRGRPVGCGQGLSCRAHAGRACARD